MNLVDKFKILGRMALDARYPKIFSFHDCLPDVFTRYCEVLLLKRFRVLSADEFFKKIKAKEKFGKEVLLTFDDGRRNCWTVIFPLLKKFNIKASIFVVPSRIRDSDKDFPNLEDFWAGRVSWENLYQTHQRHPYLTWRELEVMKKSGLVEVFSHSLKHHVVAVSRKVVDFQHPGVYEMPVYFEEWLKSESRPLEKHWGAPIYESSWSVLASNAFERDSGLDEAMNQFVHKSGGFLFFKKRDWRKKLFEYHHSEKSKHGSGHFCSIADKEDLTESVTESKRLIEERLNSECSFFSPPLFQLSRQIMDALRMAGYRVVMTGIDQPAPKDRQVIVFNRIPGFWLRFLSYL